MALLVFDEVSERPPASSGQNPAAPDFLNTPGEIKGADRQVVVPAVENFAAAAQGVGVAYI